MGRCLVLAAACVAALSLFSSRGFAADQSVDRAKMIGTWKGGWPDDKKPRFEIVITADKITGTDLTNNRSMGEGSWTLDEAKKTIDAAMTSPQKNKTFLGLYALDGDTLKWASDNGSKRRPAELIHRPGQSFLMVLTRQK